MLMLDAAISAPTHAVTLTTRDPETTGEQFRRGCQNVWLALRRLTGEPVEYFGRIEFTTGRGTHSGGLRRIHAHFAVKSPALAGLEGEAVKRIKSAWMARNVGAWRVEVAPLRTPAGALHYLSLHHAKAEQLPPHGWKGRTERASRGYWHKPSGDLRKEARRQLWAERLAWGTGLSLDDAFFWIEQHESRRAEQRELYAEYREAMAWVPLPQQTDEAVTDPQTALDLYDADIPF